jgi:hypothetical protein
MRLATTNATKTRIRRVLDITTTIGFFVIAVAFLILMGWKHYHREATAKLEPGLRKDATLPPLNGLAYGESLHTLIIALETNCQECIASTAFYNRLKDLAQGKPVNDVRIVAIFPNGPGEVKEYVERSNLQVQTVPGVDFAELNLAGTPSLMVVTREGTLRDFWVGRLAENVEQEVLRGIGISH